MNQGFYQEVLYLHTCYYYRLEPLLHRLPLRLSASAAAFLWLSYLRDMRRTMDRPAMG